MNPSMLNPPRPTEDPRDMHVYGLIGLPFVALVERKRQAQTFAGELPGGTKFTIEHCEQAFNGALVLDAIDGAGACRRIFPSDGLVILAEAERRYGCTIEQALPKWLTMPKTDYDRWEDRPRVTWHGRVLA